MVKTGLIIVIILITILGFGIYFLYGNSYNTTESDNLNSQQNTNSNVQENEVSPTANPNVPQTYPIEIKNFDYSPKTLTIKKGDTIVWTNKDGVGHTATSDSGNELSSNVFGKDSTYSHTFNTVGTFNYHCAPHPYMKATIIVQ